MYNNGYRSNYNRGYNRGYQNNDYNSGNYNGGYNNGRNMRPKKHSGAKMIKITRGKMQGADGISAWNYSRERGMVSVLIAPYEKSAVHKSKTGREWVNMMAKVFYKRTGQTVIHSALYDMQRGFAIIKDLGWKVNPKAPNGGYCGTFVRKS